MTLVSFNRVSSNRKVGPIPTSMSERETCPDSCALKGTACYAEVGPTLWHWKKVNKDSEDKKVFDWDGFTSQVKKLPRGQLWRHNVAGDLPARGVDETKIDVFKLKKLTAANKGKRGFTYTHHDPALNCVSIEVANREGFTINLSADHTQQAIEYRETYGLPTVSVVTMDFWESGNHQRVGGVDFIRCPAEYNDDIQCSNCGACAVPNRKSVIGFTAHGVRKKKADLIARG